MLSVTNKPIMLIVSILSVVMLNVVMLNVVAPAKAILSGSYKPLICLRVKQIIMSDFKTGVQDCKTFNVRNLQNFQNKLKCLSLAMFSA
jgi:hypothetical protein